MSYFFKKMSSLVGVLTLVANEKSVVAILWEADDENRVPLSHCKETTDNPLLIKTQEQLREYFCGKRFEFDLPLEFKGTRFQKKVWNELRRISYGKTLSYGALAKKIGNPKASRAVGAANGRNPISIIVPCHRVIGSDGSLTGFAGGLKMKKTLLEIEKRNIQGDPRSC